MARDRAPGTIYTNRQGEDVVILEKDSSRRCSYFVQFQDEHKAVLSVQSGNLDNKSFANPFRRTVAGVGYYGQGKYVAKLDGFHTEEYEKWNSMLKRCYKSAKHMPTYQDKSVCEEWHNFQRFAEWANKQIGFGIPEWHLDKDLLMKGNLVYGPDTCVYLPPIINSFIRRKRRNALPLGVDIAYKYNGTPYFRTQAIEKGRVVCLGGFSNVEDAFNAYKLHKESLAKELAGKWKAKIDPRAYEALINYNVEITD